MTATATRPTDALLIDALEAAHLHPTSATKTWVEQPTPNRPGPRIHFQVRIREKPDAVFAGEHELCLTEAEIVAWVVALILETKDLQHWWSWSDGGTDPAQGYRKVRPLWGYGWGPVLSARQQRVTGRSM